MIMGQIGIPKYKDLINKEKLLKMKEAIQNITLAYKILSDEKSVNNRESEIHEKYVPQYNEDMIALKTLRDEAIKVMDACNESLYNISARAIAQHFYNWDEDNIIEN